MISKMTLDARKAMVRDGYDAVAEAWAEHRRTTDDRELREWLDRFCAALAARALVLDLGCGSGEPILAELIARGYSATGVDFSPVQVAAARRRCPGAVLLEADLTEVEFGAGSFDGVIAYDSIWHVPHEQHALVFARIRSFLVSGGVALITLGAAPDAPSEQYNPMMGAPNVPLRLAARGQPALADRSRVTVVREQVEPMDPAQPDCGHMMVELRAA